MPKHQTQVVKDRDLVVEIEIKTWDTVDRENRKQIRNRAEH